jgi:hypothetical protein
MEHDNYKTSNGDDYDSTFDPAILYGIEPTEDQEGEEESE